MGAPNYGTVEVACGWPCDSPSMLEPQVQLRSTPGIGAHVRSTNEPAHNPDELMSVGEMSQRTGVPVSSLHYYERLELIASQRTAGNQRRYPRFMLRRVALISVAKRLGIPLEDVKEAFIDVPLTTTPTQEDWQRASRSWKKVLEQRRLGIERLEQELTGCIGCGCLSMKACALLNPDDALGNTGAGALRLPV